MRGRISQFAVTVLWLAGATGQLWAQEPLTISTTSLPSTTVGSNVQIKIAVNGGALPLTWKVSSGKLPPGLRLSAAKGTVSGIPTTPGAYRFAITVSDSSIPAMQVQREYTLVITGMLSIEWKQAPAVDGQALGGSVVVANTSNQDVTLTVIVMAVNEIGRATALGYQEFTLRSGAQQAIPFGSEPGPGTYIVHADAVAEVVKTNSIYRARKQTTGPLVIESPE